MKVSLHIKIGLLFITIYTILGLSIYQDYGFHWDEPSIRGVGIVNAFFANYKLDYALVSKEKSKELLTSNSNPNRKIDLSNIDSLRSYDLQYYGPAFEILLIGMEYLVAPDSKFKAFQLRHLATFLFYCLGAFCFYLLIYDFYPNWQTALLGTLLLLLSPRIFAHSFYNSKDIPFLTSFIIASLFFFRFFRKPSYLNTLLFALTTSLAIDIRILGIIFPTLSILVIILKTLYPKWQSSNLKFFILYLFFTLCFTVLFWPFLWDNPVQHFMAALQNMSKYPWPGEVLFLREIIRPLDGLPWHYIPVWFGLTIPLSYLLIFPLAFFTLSYSRISNLLKLDSTNSLTYFALGLFLGPWVIVIVLNSVLYDGWRHLFFTYPFFVILVLQGLLFVKEWLGKKVFLGIIVVALSMNIFNIIRLHPYQMTYFNPLVKNDIPARLEIEYWGLSYFEGLKYLHQTTKGSIKVSGSDYPVEFTIEALPDSWAQRISYVKDIEQADYFLTTYRTKPDREAYLNHLGLNYNQEVFSVSRNGLKLMSVFKLSER